MTGCAREGLLAGIGIAACLEPSGANSTFEPLLNPKNETTTYTDSCRINVDLGGAVTATIHTLSAGQGHETLVAAVIGEVLEIDPDRIRVVRPDSLSSLPSQSPVGSRMAIMLGGAAFHAAQKLKQRLIAMAAMISKIRRSKRSIATAMSGRRERAEPPHLGELVTIAHRHFHRLPPGTEPGLAFTHVMQVPTGGACRRPMAACRCIPASPSNSIWFSWQSIPISASRDQRAISSAMIAAPSSIPRSCAA